MIESNSHWDEHEVASTLFGQGKYEETFAKYRALAEAGSTTAQVFVGWLYYKGQGVKRDVEEARRWYKKAAEAGSPVGQFYLGALYRTQQVYEQAIEWIERSASQGYLPAIYYLSMMYESGEGVSPNREKARRYLEHAATMGHLPAKKEIAVRMIKGYDGLFRIPRGFFMLAQVLTTAVRLAWSDPESDRIRW